MAEEKQHWKDALRSTQQERDRSDDKPDPREQKKVARQMYLKRKLDKDIKNYTKDNNPIKYKDIERIQAKYGF